MNQYAKKALILSGISIAVAIYVSAIAPQTELGRSVPAANRIASLVGMAAGLLAASGVLPGLWAIWNLARKKHDWKAFPLWLVVIFLMSALMIFGAHQSGMNSGGQFGSSEFVTPPHPPLVLQS